MTVLQTVTRSAEAASTPVRRRSGVHHRSTGSARPSAGSAERGPRWRGVHTLCMGLALSFLSFGPALAERTIEGRVNVVRDVDTIVVAGSVSFSSRSRGALLASMSVAGPSRCGLTTAPRTRSERKPIACCRHLCPTWTG